MPKAVGRAAGSRPSISRTSIRPPRTASPISSGADCQRRRHELRVGRLSAFKLRTQLHSRDTVTSEVVNAERTRRVQRHAAFIVQRTHVREPGIANRSRLILPRHVQRRVLVASYLRVVIAVEQQSAGLQHRTDSPERRNEMSLVACLVRSLHRDDGIEQSQSHGPVRVAKVALQERHPVGHFTQMPARELVHRVGEIERDVAADTATSDNIQCKMTRPRTNLQDVERIAIELRERGAKCGENTGTESIGRHLACVAPSATSLGGGAGSNPRTTPALTKVYTPLHAANTPLVTGTIAPWASWAFASPSRPNQNALTALKGHNKQGAVRSLPSQARRRAPAATTPAPPAQPLQLLRHAVRTGAEKGWVDPSTLPRGKGFSTSAQASRSNVLRDRNAPLRQDYRRRPATIASEHSVMSSSRLSSIRPASAKSGESGSRRILARPSVFEISLMRG